MRLTAAIPAFNAAPTLGRVVSAAKDQLRGGDVLLVADDGSVDDTAKVAEAAGARCIRLDSNRGLACARNVLLENADTELIAYLDADAVPRPGTLDTLRAGFDTAAVGGTGGRGVECGKGGAASRWRAKYAAQDHGQSVIDDDWMLMGICFCFRTEVLRGVGGFDESYRRYGEDVDVSLRVRAAGYRLRYLPDAVADHLREDGFRGVVSQAYGHTRYACEALRRNGRTERLTAYRRDTISHLSRTALRSLLRVQPVDAAVGSANLLARIAAMAAAR